MNCGTAHGAVALALDEDVGGLGRRGKKGTDEGVGVVGVGCGVEGFFCCCRRGKGGGSSWRYGDARPFCDCGGTQGGGNGGFGSGFGGWGLRLGEQDAAVGEIADAHVYAYYGERVFVSFVAGRLGVVRVEVAVGQMREELGG